MNAREGWEDIGVASAVKLVGFPTDVHSPITKLNQKTIPVPDPDPLF